MRYLDDKRFLRELDLEDRKQQYIRITVLDFNTEHPIGSIEGVATGGTVNLNGSSNIRRTMSCSLLVNPMGIFDNRYKDYNNSYANIMEIKNLISLNKKVRAEVGFDNTLAWRGTGYYPEYDKIWIPLGLYIIKNANAAKSASGINISLTLNDKTALLNGDVGGVIPAATVFSENELYSADAKSRTVEKVLIKDIVKYLVVDFGGEDPNNVIIEDIPDSITKVMKWTGEQELYLYKDGGSYFYNTTLPDTTTIIEKTFQYGEDIGLINEPFVYPGTLECSAGETVAAVLDKIKNTLGNYEWFYDVYGRFHFQEKKNYLNTSFSTSLLELDTYDYLFTLNFSKSVYTFDKSNRKLLTNISNNPQYKNVKNDFIIWGARKTATGASKPIKYHLAFDIKPDVDPDKERLCIVYTDYRDLEQVIVLNSSNMINEKPVSSLSYEKDKYYILDNTIFHWDEDIQKMRKFDKENDGWELCYLKTDDWRTELYFLGLENENKAFQKNYYAAELNSEWTKIYDVRYSAEEVKDGLAVYFGGYRENIDFYDYDYFLDFLDNSGGGNKNLTQFCVDNIGRRTVIGKDTSANCIFSKSVPELVIILADGDVSKELEEIANKGQTAVRVSEEIFNKLVLGGSKESAYDKIRELLVQHTTYNESVSLTTIPIYYLEPNTRIFIEDSDVGLRGDYMINTISLPLAIGTSTISCSRAISREGEGDLYEEYETKNLEFVTSDNETLLVKKEMKGG